MREITVIDQTLMLDEGYTIGFRIKEETENPKNPDGSTDWSKRVPAGRYRFEIDMERVDKGKIAKFDYSWVEGQAPVRVRVRGRRGMGRCRDARRIQKEKK